MLTTLAISGYRSLREVVVPLSGLTVVTGPNGAGKSSLHKALRLLAEVGQGQLISSLATEGGLDSVLWAGPESLAGARRGHPTQGTVRSRPVALQLGFGVDDGFGYLIDLGLPSPTGAPTAFARDPQIKREIVFHGANMRPATTLVTRSWSTVAARGAADPLTTVLAGHRSMLHEFADPAEHPELHQVRDQLRSWRFYDGFRTDATAPARQPCVGTRTPVLAADAGDLAAAVQTIREEDGTALDRVVDDAFPGSELEVAISDDGRFDLALQQPGMIRPLAAAELSDGTLRFLCWSAALLTVAPAPLMVLNEPETSLHPDLVPALGRLILEASRRTQVVVVTHSAALRDSLGDAASDVALHKELGETRIVDQGLLTTPVWSWGRR